MEQFTLGQEQEVLSPMSTDNTLRMLHQIDFDELFRQSHDKIVLNRYDFSTQGYSQRLTETIFSRATDIDFVAKCECEHLQGNFYIGQICPRCHTPVTLDMESTTGYLQHKTWIECPKEIHGWMNPSVFFVLSRWLSYGKKIVPNYTNAKGDITNKSKRRKGNYIEDILDINTPVPDDLIGIVTEKGFNYFYDNFDYLMEYFLDTHKKTSSKKDVPFIRAFIEKYRDKVFCRHLPVLSSSLHSVVMSEGTRENRKRYVDKICQYVQHAAQTLSYLEFAPRRHKRMADIEDATFSAYQSMVAYCSTIAKKHLSEKRSLPRTHIFGSRLHLSSRSVIVPIMGKHRLDELHMPWGVVVNQYRPDIIGIMMRVYGMDFKTAYNRHQRALVRYDQLIYDILMGMIRDCPYKGFPVLFNRNPSVKRGSLQTMFVCVVKKDPEDETIGMSPLSVALPNADFDGDKFHAKSVVVKRVVEW